MIRRLAFYVGVAMLAVPALLAAMTVVYATVEAAKHDPAMRFTLGVMAYGTVAGTLIVFGMGWKERGDGE